MRLKRRYKTTTDFNMVSLTDIMSLLLLFFMLAFSVASPNPLPAFPKGLHINLPTSHSADVVAPQIQVTINAQLDYFVDNEPVHPDHLHNVLQKKINQTSHLILLQIDRKVPIQHMIQVVDIANLLNVQISVATQQEGEK